MFYIKVKDGVTKTLYNRLSQCPGKISTIPVMVEGPYGGNSPGQRCRHLVYVAGGNGIPGLYSECIDVDRRAPENKTIKLVWVVRNWKSVTWFADELKRLESTRVQAMVFVTRPDDLSGFDSSSNKALKQPYQYEKESVEKIETKSVDLSIYSHPNSIVENLRQELSHVEFIEGKPSMDAMVQYETEKADMSLAFITCGHPMMVDELRVAVKKNLDNTPHRVDFFEQLQGWS